MDPDRAGVDTCFCGFWRMWLQVRAGTVAFKCDIGYRRDSTRIADLAVAFVSLVNVVWLCGPWFEDIFLG